MFIPFIQIHFVTRSSHKKLIYESYLFFCFSLNNFPFFPRHCCSKSKICTSASDNSTIRHSFLLLKKMALLASDENLDFTNKHKGPQVPNFAPLLRLFAYIIIYPCTLDHLPLPVLKSLVAKRNLVRKTSDIRTWEHSYIMKNRCMYESSVLPNY